MVAHSLIAAETQTLIMLRGNSRVQRNSGMRHFEKLDLVYSIIAAFRVGVSKALSRRERVMSPVADSFTNSLLSFTSFNDWRVNTRV